MPEDIGTNKHLKVVGKTVRGRLVTAEMTADSLGGKWEKNAFQQSILIDGHGDDLELARVAEAQNVPVENVIHLTRGSSKAVTIIINFVAHGGDSLSIVVQSDHMEYNATHLRSYAKSSAPQSG